MCPVHHAYIQLFLLLSAAAWTVRRQDTTAPASNLASDCWISDQMEMGIRACSCWPLTGLFCAHLIIAWLRLFAGLCLCASNSLFGENNRCLENSVTDDPSKKSDSWGLSRIVEIPACHGFFLPSLGSVRFLSNPYEFDGIGWISIHNKSKSLLIFSILFDPYDTAIHCLLIETRAGKKKRCLVSTQQSTALQDCRRAPKGAEFVFKFWWSRTTFCSGLWRRHEHDALTDVKSHASSRLDTVWHTKSRQRVASVDRTVSVTDCAAFHALGVQASSTFMQRNKAMAFRFQVLHCLWQVTTRDLVA